MGIYGAYRKGAFKMRNIIAVFMKQLKETLKNKAILIQFVMLPVMAVIMENFIKTDGMPERFFVKLFSIMFIGMAPLTCMSSIIAEEKEMNTLRTLLMSNVKPVQYLIGTGFYVWLFCMFGAVIFAVCGKYGGTELAQFLLIMASGIILSELIGGIIGVCSKNQMTSTSVGIPIMMIFSFIPMLAMFNETIEKIAGIVYSQQLSIIMNDIGGVISAKNIVILMINFILAFSVFIMMFRKKGLE